ncbi:DUF5606 domain-containing protein [Arthrospiribacter ruber]|uniref:DUF5606 domain-containing protein n=1 Tax=Arthrospiribacter ruber TaxID=2487934 RepID=A0A951IZ47_9BACT|nr:DUF5606 domain-containing protein [Arthrospiribacter ruber]MBW3468959.1 hypothetical protein [Arthrospiribacter ruber]
MNFNEIATVSGKPGLYKILKPTKGGVILESLDEKKSKLVVGANHRVSILAEISIYTMNEDGATPLQNVMAKIEEEFEGDLGLESGADADELRAFLKHVLPDYDEAKVYPSDIKKLVAWYQIIRNNAPEALQASDDAEENTAEEDKGE